MDHAAIHSSLFQAFQEDASGLSSVYAWIGSFKAGRKFARRPSRWRTHLDHIDSQILSGFPENGFQRVPTPAPEMRISLSAVHR
jgi:hypothetical protein